MSTYFYILWIQAIKNNPITDICKFGVFNFYPPILAKTARFLPFIKEKCSTKRKQMIRLILFKLYPMSTIVYIVVSHIIYVSLGYG